MSFLQAHRRAASRIERCRDDPGHLLDDARGRGARPVLRETAGTDLFAPAPASYRKV
ncbi:hypothetical protein ABH922_002939 [Rhodococcus sp. 27YEA15]|uniref:hypothetical protein n=1 Tax=Rhodococcus sp. 27YEA15 TaxID=3156259 RepID=UPI003C7A8539